MRKEERVFDTHDERAARRQGKAHAGPQAWRAKEAGTPIPVGA